jgi:cytochrome c oxidase subunit 2
MIPPTLVASIGAPPLAQLRMLYDRDPSMFKTAGPMAAGIATLGWTMIILATIVFLIVMTVLLLPLWRRRNAPPVDGPPLPVNERAWLLYAGTAAPALILAGIFVLTFGVYRTSAPDVPLPLTIEVIGHQWWWEVRYPDKLVLTADEIHLPVGRPVKIVLRSDDVIHSFWVPNLAGKTDVIPGVVNATWLEADAPGTWRGACAEYCGMQHAHMALSVVAQADGDFARWVENERATSRPPTDSATLDGEHAFLTSQCVYCHTVRGTQATGRVGPDLTHIASRLTLASGTLPNTRGNLAGWIENPDRIKPGTKMPAIPLDAGRLQAIVTYLESLK